jgi:hypothetical protein
MSALVTYVQSAVGRVNPVCPGRMYGIVTWLLTVGMWIKSHLTWLYAYYSAMQAAVHKYISVLDRRCRILKVVLVRHLLAWELGFWEFGGGRDWGKGWERGGQFTSNLRPRWTDPVTARRVPSK